MLGLVGAELWWCSVGHGDIMQENLTKEKLFLHKKETFFSIKSVDTMACFDMGKTFVSR